MSPMLKEVLTLTAEQEGLDPRFASILLQGLREDLVKRERTTRERLQVLECWRALAEDGAEREAMEFFMDFYRLRLNDIDSEKRHPRTYTVATSMNDYGYSREKGRELKAEGEGLSRSCPEDENFGDEAGVR